MDGLDKSGSYSLLESYVVCTQSSQLSYCSPTGEHLSSCKEVSSYLKPYLGINENDAKLEGADPQELQVVDSIDVSSYFLKFLMPNFVLVIEINNLIIH